MSSTSVRVGLGDSENVVEYTTVPYSRNVQSKDVNVETFGITDLVRDWGTSCSMPVKKADRC